MLAGWVMAYTWTCASGALTGLSHPQVVTLWHDFLAKPGWMAAWHAAFIVLVGIISARGVNRGLELANRIRAPVLLVLMLILVAYALSAGDWRRGLAFAFSLNFAAITPPVVDRRWRQGKISGQRGRGPYARIDPANLGGF